MISIWNHYLFQPVFNTLLYLYNEVTAQNFGWAIVYLTILIRFILLPFSIISVWKEGFHKKISKEISKIALAHKNDPVLQNQEIREFLKTHRINPWSKAIVLGVQAITLVLLYQVFLGGIRGTKMDQLYTWVDRPDFVNTIFLGFDLAARNFIWPGIVAVLLFIEISVEQRKKKKYLLNSDIVYKYFFPLTVFTVLAFLPMVKALFILTSLIFSAIVVGGAKIFIGHLQRDKKVENAE